MDSSTTNGIEVTVAAIDGTNLVLESLNDKTRFLWPLDKIPRPLEIGNRLTLELQKTSTPASFTSSEKSPSSSPSDAKKDDLMRKLLEELVN